MRFQGRVLHVQIASDVKSLPPLRYSCRPLPSSCLLAGLDWATKSPTSGFCLPATRNGEKGLETELEKEEKAKGREWSRSQKTGFCESRQGFAHLACLQFYDDTRQATPGQRK